MGKVIKEEIIHHMFSEYGGSRSGASIGPAEVNRKTTLPGLSAYHRHNIDIIFFELYRARYHANTGTARRGGNSHEATQAGIR